jgi:ABC-type multidrug transport system permease subunit
LTGRFWGLSIANWSFLSFAGIALVMLALLAVLVRGAKQNQT